VDHDAYLAGIAELYAAEDAFVPSGPQQGLAGKAAVFVSFIMPIAPSIAQEQHQRPMAGMNG
jgi:hypothetical protein